MYAPVLSGGVFGAMAGGGRPVSPKMVTHSTQLDRFDCSANMCPSYAFVLNVPTEGVRLGGGTVTQTLLNNAVTNQMQRLSLHSTKTHKFVTYHLHQTSVKRT